MGVPQLSGSYAGEKTLLTTRPTRFIAFRYYVLLVVSLILAAGTWFLQPLQQYANVTFAIAGWSLDRILAVFFLLIALYGLLRGELTRVTTRYVITDNKIIREDGILNKSTQMIPYTQLERLDLRQSFLQRILHIGTLVVDTGDDSLEIEMIPRPAQIQELLSDRLGRRAYVEQR
ncbi:MAG TPA: PH domain-containing protein [Thermoplasmata archaeon]|jgi:uncharacterized membrane protein YdbT with pleckstrin-like domain